MAGAKNKDAADAVSRLADSLLGELGGKAKADNRFREEIRKETDKEGEALGQFLGLVESFTEIIPEEDRRYSAAMKALAQTSGLSREDLLKAAESRLSVLDRLAEGLRSASEGWRDGLKNLESKAKEIRDRISELEEEVRGLEKEEEETLKRISAAEAQAGSARSAIDEAVGDLAEELRGIKDKLTEYGEAPAAGKPAPAKGARAAKRPSAKGTAGERTCPNCRGRMDWYEVEKTWKCFVCAHEESG